MVARHERHPDGCDCTWARLAEHLVLSGSAADWREAATVATGILIGAGAAILHPEWAQALIKEDDARIGTEDVALFQAATRDMVRGVPIAVITEPRESPP